MKLTTLFLTVGILTVCARGVSQHVTFKGEKVSLKSVFKSVEKQTDFLFLYPESALRSSKPVSLNAQNLPLEQFLAEVFKSQPLEYTIKGKSIFVSPKVAAPKQEGISDPPADTLIWVIGKVQDERGGPVIGASVAVKGTELGTTTNTNGEFAFRNVSTHAILVISSIGFEKEEVKVNKGSLKITLSKSTSELGEVTVSTGYQQIDRRRLTSAITTLKAKDILSAGMFSIDQALEGRVPGLFVMNPSGDIGVAPKIRIRGTSTLLGNREPVWVVDGVVVNDPVNIDPASINDLDFVNRLGNAISGLKPFDIEQIDILKDASATALYGVRAANGVIVITTKKGKTGAPVVNFNQSTSIVQRSHYTDANVNVMNSRQRIDFSRDLIDKGLNYSDHINYVGYEGALTKLYNGEYSYEAFQQDVHRMETINTDWFDVILHNAVSTQNNLSVSGGNEKTKYFASVGAATQRSTIRGDKIDQYSALIKLNTALSSRLTWELNFRGNTEKRDFVSSSVNALSYAYNTSRAVPAYNEGGDLNYYKRYSSSASDYFRFNILNEMAHSRNNIDASGLALNTNLNYKLNKHLNGTLLLSFNNNNTEDRTAYEENTFSAAEIRLSEYGMPADPARTTMPYGGEYRSSNVRNRSYLVRGQANFTHPVGVNKRDQLDITMGGEMSSNQYNGLKMIRRGYMKDRGQIFAPVDPVKYPKYAEWSTINNMDQITNNLTNIVSGYLATAYTFNDKYILNFNTRTDFSNKFGSRSREKFLPTWSVSGRWDIDKDFFKNSRAVNMMALKASYGYQGNMLDNQTPDLIINQGSLDPISEEYYSTIAYYPNPNLKWEKNGELNIGLDFSLFNNKIQGTVNYFDKKTENAFLDKRVADINGLTTYVVNSGTIRNKGVEIALSFMPINNLGPKGGGNGFSWRIDPQLGQVLNSILSNSINHYGLNKYLGSLNANLYNDYLTGNQTVNGKAVNTFYSYAFNGLDHKTGKPTFKNDDEALRDKYRSEEPDDVFRQVMVPTGNRIPTIQGGILNTFSYKGFALSFNLAYSLGSKIRLTKLYTATDQQLNSGVAAPMPENNVRLEFENRWRKPGDEAFTNISALIGGRDFSQTLSHWSMSYPFSYAKNMWEMYDNADIRVVSGSYLKLRTINFRYTLPDHLNKYLNIKAANVMFSAMNVHTWASKDLHGQDPEQTGFGDMIQVSPRPTYSFTIDVSF
ncbi:SusC/RagA family TonB-linked outer membrane protein [Chitinophaga arvensicola]|nr:SusC/RagA family TonB-linked outer membrane protein [Chitinophaga arvensicola]